MKNTLLFASITIIFFSSCDKEKTARQTSCVQQGDYDYLDNYLLGSLCTSDTCTEYLTIWKELIQEKNNLNQDFLDNHIDICNTEMNSWDDGVSFNVCYKVKIGWAIAYNCDGFIVKIEKDNTFYPTLDLPRDTYLTKEDIRIATDNRAFSSHITNLSNAVELEFTTMENALNSLIDYSGVNMLCFNSVMLDEVSGNLFLEAFAQYENEENSCIRGTIDLISGQKEVNDTPCYIMGIN